MSVSLTLARTDHLSQLLPLVGAFHAEAGLKTTAEHREAALLPLLEGSPHGAVYIIGPERAPVGYVALGFGWSLEFGGMDGFIDEIYVRPNVRGRGIGTEVLVDLLNALSDAGVKAMHLEVAPDNTKAERIYAQIGFKPRTDMRLMTRLL